MSHSSAASRHSPCFRAASMRFGVSLLATLCLSVAACGGGGGGKGSSPLPPAPTATPQPTAVPSIAIEAATGIVTATVVGVAAFVTGIPVSGTSGSGAEMGRTAGSVRRAAVAFAATADVAGAASGGGAATSSCARGGTISASCNQSGGSTTIPATFSNCGLVDPATGDTVTASGGLTLVIAATGICGTGFVPPLAAMTAQFQNLTGTVMTPTGSVVEHFTANFTETITPVGQGCAGTNGRETFDGALRVQTSAGIDVSLDAHGLTTNVQSSGSPCAQSVTASGGLDIEDHVQQRQFSAALDALALVLVDLGGNAASAAVDGMITAGCVGTIEVHTGPALQFGSGSTCPIGGKLAVMRRDETNGIVAFSPSGLDFDYDADGRVDRSIASCSDAAACSG